jgi:ABC-type proline/glycine betaine transport system permease subunit
MSPGTHMSMKTLALIVLAAALSIVVAVIAGG